MDEHPVIPSELRAAAEALGDALARSELIAAFDEAQRRLDADEHARLLLDEVAEADGELRRKQVEGILTRADIDRARDAHRAASVDASIRGFREAHQAAAAFLPEVDIAISKLLGWDFAAMAAAPLSC